ncbi:MAG: HAD family hydrolase [Burkholderiales bacterium]
MTTPAIRFDPELLLRARGVKVAFFDVDGVLTDGGLYFAENPPSEPSGARESIKRFHTLDGHGMKLLQKAGITPAVVTGRDSLAVRARLAALGITNAMFGTEDKRPAAENLLEQLGADWSQAAVIGDDWPDLPMLRRASLACAPPGAHVEVLAAAHYVTSARAGHGAAREFCDLLMVASGCYQALLSEYLR